jgi:hypothetical protein
MRNHRRIASRLALTAMLAGCGADPSVLLDGRGGDPRTSKSATDPADPAGQGSTSGPAPLDDGAVRDAGAASSDAGVTTLVDASSGDAATGDASAVVTAFSGAAAFVATTGPSARMAAHVFAGNTPTTNPAKQPCLACHVAGGAATPFAFAGTAFKDVAGTLPAAGVEIRVRAPDGTAVSAYTDQDGNFYQATAMVFPASVGLRNSTSARGMMAMPPAGGCNAAQCHDGDAHPWVYLP